MLPDYRESNCPDKDGQSYDIADFDQSLRLKELINHLDFVEYLVASETPRDLSKRLLKIFNQFGFSDFALMGFPHNHKPHVFLTSLPKELLVCYQGPGAFSHDMLLDYLKTDNPTHFHHSDIQQIIESACIPIQNSDKNRGRLELYKKFEFYDAYLMPYTGNNPEKENKDRLLFSLLTKRATPKEFMALTKFRGAALHLLGDTAIRVYQNRFNDHNPLPRIDPKPIQLLKPITKVNSKPNQATDKLCISIDASNNHLALAKKIRNELKSIQVTGQSSRAG